MTWGYRIIRFRDPDPRYALHEVYFDESGAPRAASAAPVTFESKADREDILKALQAALAEAAKFPILEDYDIAEDNGNGLG